MPSNSGRSPRRARQQRDSGRITRPALTRPGPGAPRAVNDDRHPGLRPGRHLGRQPGRCRGYDAGCWRPRPARRHRASVTAPPLTPSRSGSLQGSRPSSPQRSQASGKVEILPHLLGRECCEVLSAPGGAVAIGAQAAPQMAMARSNAGTARPCGYPVLGRGPITSRSPARNRAQLVCEQELERLMVAVMAMQLEAARPSSTRPPRGRPWRRGPDLLRCRLKASPRTW
jgi:hypothetical protein